MRFLLALVMVAAMGFGVNNAEAGKRYLRKGYVPCYHITYVNEYKTASGDTIR